MDAGIPFILLSSSVLIYSAALEQRYVYDNNNHRDWARAQTFCRESYTDLVTVHDTLENQKLVSLSENLNDCIWIGLHYSSDWKWSNGHPFVHTEGFWAQGQPDLGNENCGAIAAGGFHDGSCTALLSFACFDAQQGTGGTQLIMVKETKNWTAAQEYCRTNHGDLVSVDDSETVPVLQEMMVLEGVALAWIGLRRKQLVWSDNSKSSFRNWESEPDVAADGGCGCLWDTTGKWEVLPCTVSKRFFCYGAEPLFTTTLKAGTSSLAKVDARKQTVLKMRLQSAASMNDDEVQQQILKQIKSKMESVGAANFTMKWRDTRKMANP